MTLTSTERTILAVVEESKGRRDTRSLDFEYYSRSSDLLEPHLLQVLRALEERGLVSAIAIPGGTGPGWVLTDKGRDALSNPD